MITRPGREKQPVDGWRTVTLAVMVLLLLSAAGCSPRLHSGNLDGPATLTMKVDSTINGMRRSALVHLPQSFDHRRRYPLVVVLHGAFSTAERMEEVTGFSDLADREGFIVLYPEGMGIFGLLQHWNAGHCCGKAAEDRLDDVGFIEECIDRLAGEVLLDTSRIYVTGFSNGGMLAHRFAAEKSGWVAAMAALGAAVGGRSSKDVPLRQLSPPRQPVPALLVHGMSDEVVPFEGGGSPRRRGERQYLPFRDSIRFWLRANGCGGQAEQHDTLGGRVEIKRYTGCMNDAEVIVYTIEGWGHRWPGTYYMSQDETFRGFDISLEIWRFFERFSKDDA